MPSSGMLGRASLVITDVSQEPSVFIIRVTVNVVPSSPIFVILIMDTLRSSESSVLTRATRRNVREVGVLQLGK
jgi:hypothetical protein